MKHIEKTVTYCSPKPQNPWGNIYVFIINNKLMIVEDMQQNIS